MSGVQKAIAQFGTYESRRAAAYVTGKVGYDEGFLPRKTSPVRFPRKSPTAEQTAAEPRRPRQAAATTPEYSQWKRQMSERRREYMSGHIRHEEVQKPRKLERDRKTMLRGVEDREALLSAPESQAELLSLPSIERTIADEYPLVDHNKGSRALKRERNREQDERFKEETRLHHFLTIHHNSAGYVTTLSGLDALVEKAIGTAAVFNPAPQYRLAELGSQPTIGAYSFGKVHQIEAEIDDQMMGTASGGRPGVLEVLQSMSNERDGLSRDL